MFSRRILAAVTVLCALAAPAYAQKTKAQLSTEVGITYPDNTGGQITPLGVRTYENDLLNSIMPTAPVVSGNLACFNGTTGLLQDCGSAPTIYGTGVLAALGINVGSVGSVLLNGGALGVPASATLTNATGLPIASGVSGLGTGIATALGVNVGSAGAPIINGSALGAPSSGTLTNVTGLPISTGVSGLGTGAATALSANVGTAGAFVVNGGALGVPSSGTLTNATGLPVSTGISGLGTGAATALGNTTNASGGVMVPTPTRAGDIFYWNGSAVVNLPGNNSGTQFLQENASGVPAWATVAGTGTVTTITAGYGVSLSSGATCTTSCTDSVSLTSLSNYLIADVTLNNISTFFAGPTVAQGTSGTWFATGCITGASTGAADAFVMKLWDGATVISSGLFRAGSTQGASGSCISGIITSPAGNLRIDVQDLTSVNGTMKFNSTGLSKDSFILVYRLG